MGVHRRSDGEHTYSEKKTFFNLPLPVNKLDWVPFLLFFPFHLLYSACMTPTKINTVG